MKRYLALFLILCLLPLGVLAEDGEADLTTEDVVEEVLLDDDNTFVDDETGETFVLTEEEQQKLDELLEEQPEEEEDIDPDSLDLNPNLPDNVINILLIGVDTRSKNPEEIIGRGDTQIIVSVNRDTGSIKMTSILRDTYVSIPGYKNKTKINNAFQYGCNKVKKGELKDKIRSGASLAMRTINKNFEMNLQNYVAINFNGLASIIDALGGIDIELTKGEAWYINKYLKEHPPAYDNKAKGERTSLQQAAGTQHLDGVQAVMYARIRSLSGENDFNRTDRQRHLLDLLLQMVMSNLDINTLMDLIDIATSYAATNMNFETMFNLARSLIPALSSHSGNDSLFEQMRIPADDTWKYGTVNGTSVIMFKKSAHPAEDLHNFIYGAYYSAN
ncbi:MAG: LCP family protein [Clostridia bacterium]|nr:LCP family protein [Clostridia bacterium]